MRSSPRRTTEARPSRTTAQAEFEVPRSMPSTGSGRSLMDRAHQSLSDRRRAPKNAGGGVAGAVVLAGSDRRLGHEHDVAGLEREVLRALLDDLGDVDLEGLPTGLGLANELHALGLRERIHASREGDGLNQRQALLVRVRPRLLHLPEHADLSVLAIDHAHGDLRLVEPPVGELALDLFGDLPLRLALHLQRSDPREADRAVVADLVLAGELLLIGDADLEHVAGAELLGHLGLRRRDRLRIAGPVARDEHEEQRDQQAGERAHMRTAAMNMMRCLLKPATSKGRPSSPSRGTKNVTKSASSIVRS